MNVRIVTQTSKSGDVNVHLLTDPLSPIEDSIVFGPDWNEPKITRGLLIIEDKDTDDLIVNRELRAVSNVAEGEKFMILSSDDEFMYRALVEDR